jgi:hypothetical protein
MDIFTSMAPIHRAHCLLHFLKTDSLDGLVKPLKSQSMGSIRIWRLVAAVMTSIGILGVGHTARFAAMRRNILGAAVLFLPVNEINPSFRFAVFVRPAVAKARGKSRIRCLSIEKSQSDGNAPSAAL